MVNSLVLAANKIVIHPLFNRIVIIAILFSAALLGFETNQKFREEYYSTLYFLDRAVLYFFLFEIALKIIAKGRNPLQYFRDGWNLLDFFIVLGCLIPASSNALAVFRLIRVLRILRLITALPKLRLIVNALLKSIPSMGSVSVLLFIHFYAFAVLGVFLFGINDPLHFGSLGSSFLSLFTILTLEGWVDVMKIQMYGCASSDMESLKNICTSSQSQPVAAVLYFLTFIVTGTMIILNLLIGVVVGSIAEAQDMEKNSPDQSEKILKELSNVKAELERINKKLS
jgi:voltage-gated sodium channel